MITSALPSFDERLNTQAAKSVRDAEQALIAAVLLLAPDHPLREQVAAMSVEVGAMKIKLGYSFPAVPT